MDVWVFAAVAGAGIVAQRVKNLSPGNRNLPNLLSEALNSGRPWYLSSVHNVFDKRSPLQRKCLEQELYSQLAPDSGDASPEETDDSVSVSEAQTDPDVVCDDDIVDKLQANGSYHPLFIEFGSSYGSKQGNFTLRCRGVSSEFTRPHSFLDSCLLAQLFNRDSGIEERSCSAHSPWLAILHPFPVNEPIPMTRPFVHHKNFEESSADSPLGIPRLPDVASRASLVKARKKRGQLSGRRNEDTMAYGSLQKTQDLQNGRVLFCLGLAIGLLSTSGSVSEIESLKKSLKQTESLVQDLQDELEMKDSFTVRDLTAETAVNDELQGSSNAEEESFRKIEAELEAELDRLQLNVAFFRPEDILPDDHELDFVPDIAEGELRADCFSGRDDTPDSERCRSSVPTPCSNQYPVSPRLLSLKLHEVIQSRLQERIKQLEMALEQSQTRPESNYIPSTIKTPDYETGSSSSPEREQQQRVAMDLPEEAPAAYHEAKEESSSQAIEKQEAGVEQHVVLTDGCRSWNESENEEDEMERLLIKQIVEKARRGSPAILKAQCALMSTDLSSFYHQQPEG